MEVRFFFEFQLNNGGVVLLVEHMLHVVVHGVGKVNFKVKFLVILLVRLFVSHIKDVDDVHHEPFLPIGLFLPHYPY